ncbi:hypothetical protein DUI87_23012 [Hirundo rustica rustica]|uniref:Uncharacterized protein n=1 Tax=Hirundo rustica rustica TaxID=333673 RepID=A0A3M0JMX5_HIRRU|nr:hypothetical protein DUI87_23012 [Hirundo rustica rustica]
MANRLKEMILLLCSTLVEDSEIDHDETALCGLLAVVVISHLPRDAAIEWHVVAVVDNPLQRKHFAMKMLSEGFQIECESVESSSASCASISMRLSLISSSTSHLDLDGPLHDLVAMFKQAIDKLSEDCRASPLSFRAFFKDHVFDAETLRKDMAEKERIFSDMNYARIRSNSYELQQEIFQLDTGIEFFSPRVKPTGCESSTLEILKT